MSGKVESVGWQLSGQSTRLQIGTAFGTALRITCFHKALLLHDIFQSLTSSSGHHKISPNKLLLKRFNPHQLDVSYTLSYTKRDCEVRNIVVKYLEADRKTGRFKYRRRIPEVLKSVVNRGSYFEKALGTSKEDEALIAYGPVHKHFEQLLQLAKNGVSVQSDSVSHPQGDGLPLEQDTIDGVYRLLAHPKVKFGWQLLSIWTLMDHTGARPGEIRGLKGSDVFLEAPVPHIRIYPNEARETKNAWSWRYVPLVGSALKVATECVRRLDTPDGFLFPNYASPGGMDRLSGALVDRVRKFTLNPKHQPKSLRHNMKNRLRKAVENQEHSRSIQGHALSKGMDAILGPLSGPLC